MNVSKRLETVINEHLNPVIVRMMEVGEEGAEGAEAWKDLDPTQRLTALLIAGILTGVKVQMMQAGALVNEEHLDDLME